MKVPEFMFVFINPVMKFLLRSPLHGMWSDSLMLIEFTGRKSGRKYVTPVRYVRTADGIRCYSSKDTKWWRNLRGGADVSLLLAGRESAFVAHVTEDDANAIKVALEDYFSIYPQDAAYHDVRLRHNGKASKADLQRAAEHAVVVEATPVTV